MDNQLKEVLQRVFCQRREDANKGTFGCTIVIGGCKKYVGAPKFSARSANEIAQKMVEFGEGAMVSGSGTSVLAVPNFLSKALWNKVDFSAIYPLKSQLGYIKYNKRQIERLQSMASSFAIGMGFGKGESKKIVEHILARGEQNFVVDADALASCANLNFENRAVVTPHVLEMSRMIGISKSEVEQNAQEICLQYAKEHKCVVVLKSHVSYISDGNSVVKSQYGNAKLATGGSGDVLAGIIAGLLAFGNTPYDSAIAGAYILGRCAEMSQVNEFSHLASDTIMMIAKVINHIVEEIKL